MKKRNITIISDRINNPEMEEMIQKRDIELKETARKNATHFAKRKLPALSGDSLSNYTGEIRAGYEKLSTDALNHLQPDALFPEAKMEVNHYKDIDKNLEAGITENEALNRNDEYELGDFNQSTILSRIRLAVISTSIITFGEILFNTKAFQVTGENLLFAMILSVGVSFAVLIFSHITPMLFKSVKKNWQRYMVILGSLFIVTGMFIGLAMLRSTYLESHDVHINPFYFVIINLFFFIVSALLSFFVLPSWTEIKENGHKLKMLSAIKKRNKEILLLRAEKEKIKETILERNMLRIRIAHYANYTTERIRKMYFESLEVFKITNLTYRTDKGVPDCFAEILPEPDINNLNYPILTK
jgi:hypothetical protein